MLVWVSRRVGDSVSVRVRVRARVTVMVRVRVRVQTRWNHTPDTMDTTRQYGHCIHNGITHHTLGMLPGNLDIICHADPRKPSRIYYGPLHTQQTQGNHTQEAIHTTNNNGDMGLCKDRADTQ